MWPPPRATLLTTFAKCRSPKPFTRFTTTFYPTDTSNCNRQYNSQRKTNGTSAARATDRSVYPCAKSATKES
jgi:hypothetical protein